TALAAALGDLAAGTQVRDNLALPLRAGVDASAVRARLDAIVPAQIAMPVPPKALDELKFGTCLPRSLAERMLQARSRDVDGVDRVTSMRVRDVRLHGMCAPPRASCGAAGAGASAVARPL